MEALAPWAAGAPLRTIFVGGGTPSLLRVELWAEVLAALRANFDLSACRAPRTGAREGATGPDRGSNPDACAQPSIDQFEFTVECNPETVTPGLMDVLAAGGVTRVSVGAQSFDPRHLKTLERWHEPENVRRGVEMARAAGIARQSVDLIFGIPGQTLADWRQDLSRAIDLGTEHVSCYDLTYEPNTAMTKRLRRGEFEPADESLEVAMFAATLEMLRAAGLERYEVSNFARPGAECRHNLAYWRQEEWLAAGPSASAHVGGHRWKNTPRLDDYLSFDDDGFAPVVDHEAPDAARALRERIMTGLRLAEGLHAASILAAAAEIDRAPSASDGARRVHGRAPGVDRESNPGAGASGSVERLRLAAAANEQRGLMRTSGERWVLTDAGFLFADGVAADLMRAVV